MCQIWSSPRPRETNSVYLNKNAHVDSLTSTTANMILTRRYCRCRCKYLSLRISLTCYTTFLSFTPLAQIMTERHRRSRSTRDFEVKGVDIFCLLFGRGQRKCRHKSREGSWCVFVPISPEPNLSSVFLIMSSLVRVYS